LLQPHARRTPCGVRRCCCAAIDEMPQLPPGWDYSCPRDGITAAPGMGLQLPQGWDCSCPRDGITTAPGMGIQLPQGWHYSCQWPGSHASFPLSSTLRWHPNCSCKDVQAWETPSAVLGVNVSTRSRRTHPGAAYVSKRQPPQQCHETLASCIGVDCSVLQRLRCSLDVRRDALQCVLWHRGCLP
jgi:hypothetical protein